MQSSTIPLRVTDAATEPSKPESLLVDAVGLAALLGVSPRHIARLDVSGRLPMPRKLGRLKRWPISEIKAWIDGGCPERGKWDAMQRAKRK